MATNNIYLDEVKNILKSLKTEKAEVLNGKGKDGKVLSENTIHTKTYNINREIKFFAVIATLLGTIPEATVKGLVNHDKVFGESLLSLINPSSGGTRIEIKEGDNLFTLVKTYPNATVTKLTERALKVGLKLDSNGIKFIKG